LRNSWPYFNVSQAWEICNCVINRSDKILLALTTRVISFHFISHDSESNATLLQLSGGSDG
jgi:hypothetical protein